VLEVGRGQTEAAEPKSLDDLSKVVRILRSRGDEEVDVLGKARCSVVGEGVGANENELNFRGV